LLQAQENVAVGQQHVDAQRRIVGELERAGGSTALARELLETFENVLRTHEEDRDRISAELGALE
jgi:hypothetical protein